MNRYGKKIDSAWWTSRHTGRVVLAEDWVEQNLPPLKWGTGGIPLPDLQPAPLITFGDESGYYLDQDRITFLVRPARYPAIDWDNASLYVAGEFNGWNPAYCYAVWKLEPTAIEGVDYFLLNIDRELCLHEGAAQFKFITGDGRWLPVPAAAPNAAWSHDGHRNFRINPRQTGLHILQFTAPEPLSQDSQACLWWAEIDFEESVPMVPGSFYLELKTDLPLGVEILKDRTVFRLFAPRASRVTVEIFSEPDGAPGERLDMSRTDDVVWEAEYPGNLHGWFYNYYVESRGTDNFSNFDYSHKILDPYAWAATGPSGPGIIWDSERLKLTERRYQPPALKDLVIVEAHLRDLTAAAPINMDSNERMGFTGLSKWVEAEGSYLRELGVNAVELQPLHEFDAKRPENYHWGYMTTNYFAPASSYALDPAQGSQIGELQELVAAFHGQGLAVILDVVYNHVGLPNHLALIDKQYYFELDYDGEYMNWSGCGNTLRCSAPMSKRLIIESLLHFIEVYDIDGFRFDLAELLGLEVLMEIETALKAAKPSIILIAEPWSFRDNIALALKRTGFASWNDLYRDFIYEYLSGRGDQDGIRYFLAGSTGHLTSHPAQSINYLESHDDHCWIDRITENPGHNGLNPTDNDRRRTHLMAAILFSSLGVPMFSAGQDLLRSKQGTHNTYNRGDLNEIDYSRADLFPNTRDYFRGWIKFRLSERGRVLRLDSTPPEGYMRFFGDFNELPVAALINAEHSHGTQRLLFAVNPYLKSVKIELEGIRAENWTQIADHERFVLKGLEGGRFEFSDNALVLPELSCGLWVEKLIH